MCLSHVAVPPIEPCKYPSKSKTNHATSITFVETWRYEYASANNLTSTMERVGLVSRIAVT
eukprot:5320172-Pleurochrysis_carterae.AAC.1